MGRPRGEAYPIELVSRRLRIALSARELARRIGYSLDSVRQWESGHRGCPPGALEAAEAAIVGAERQLLRELTEQLEGAS